MQQHLVIRLAIAIAAITWLVNPLSADESVKQTSAPAAKLASLNQPVQVFLLLGQSNMVGPGGIVGSEIALEHAVKEKEKKLVRIACYLV